MLQIEDFDKNLCKLILYPRTIILLTTYTNSISIFKKSNFKLFNFLVILFPTYFSELRKMPEIKTEKLKI
jgi:hypothetical protein